jgi:hypothetical protein
MTDNPFEGREEEFEEAKTHYVPVIDWFILSGALTDEERFETEMLGQVLHNEVEYYFGPSTCDPGFHVAVYKDERYILDDHVVEIGALAVLGSALPIEALENLVAKFEFAPPCDGHDVAVEAAEDESGRSVWVVRRFTEKQLAAADFDAQMREFVALTHKVREAVLS